MEVNKMKKLLISKFSEYYKKKSRKVNVGFKDIAYCNNSCHINAYNEWKKTGNTMKAMLCVIKKPSIISTEVFVHVVNKDETTGELYDITLGEFGSDFYDYYNIAIGINEGESPNNYLIRVKREVLGGFYPKIIVKLLEDEI